jgi:Signal peptide peptidase
VTWYIFSERINWVWIVQDFLGVSVCLLFLTSVHLPNLKAAAMLLGEREEREKREGGREREGEYDSSLLCPISSLHPASPCCILDIEGYLNQNLSSNPINFNPIHSFKMLVISTASSLPGLAFCYDIFFVFVSPYIFGSSVMVTVATGYSGTIHTDENFCEKHPSDKDCNMNSLPMLLIVPTFSSYLSSESLLGLGDIVLPGLLLVWAAR